MKLRILPLSLGALAVVVAFLPACDRESSTQTTEEQSYEERSREFPLEMEPFKPTYFESLMAQDFFRVIYYDGGVEQPKRLQTKSPKIPDGLLPIDQEARLTFSRHIGYVPNDDYRFEKFFKADAVEFFERFGTLAYEVGNQYYQFTQPLAQAWVGGYAVFAQSDPRGIREDEDWVPLLEINSSNEHGLDILWGDSGVGAFFIRRADLRNKDFSKVLYYWDNH